MKHTILCSNCNTLLNLLSHACPFCNNIIRCRRCHSNNLRKIIDQKDAITDIDQIPVFLDEELKKTSKVECQKCRFIVYLMDYKNESFTNKMLSKFYIMLVGNYIINKVLYEFKVQSTNNSSHYLSYGSHARSVNEKLNKAYNEWFYLSELTKEKDKLANSYMPFKTEESQALKLEGYHPRRRAYVSLFHKYASCEEYAAITYTLLSELLDNSYEINLCFSEKLHHAITVVMDKYDNNIVIDPWLGFGQSVPQDLYGGIGNLTLVKRRSKESKKNKFKYMFEHYTREEEMQKVLMELKRKDWRSENYQNFCIKNTWDNDFAIKTGSSCYWITANLFKYIEKCKEYQQENIDHILLQISTLRDNESFIFFIREISEDINLRVTWSKRKKEAIEKIDKYNKRSIQRLDYEKIEKIKQQLQTILKCILIPRGSFFDKKIFHKTSTGKIALEIFNKCEYFNKLLNKENFSFKAPSGLNIYSYNDLVSYSFEGNYSPRDIYTEAEKLRIYDELVKISNLEYI